MFTDMVGYTALGQRDESLSLALVEEQRKLVRPILARHNGREIKTIGDAFLVEFPNALDAVRCAYDIQRAIREFNISMPSEQRLHLRIGVHDGDVVESNDDISGDAVNVASRIEPLAEDGSVCLTQEVYNHVRNKFELPMSSLGPKILKNVAEPMEVYKVVMPWEKEVTGSPSQLDKNRIAVLPFANMSPDPNDEYFADGMTEELIDRLAQVKSLRVIARTSVMSYKGEKKKASQIAKELEVGTLIEGSVRKAANRVRVTVQLVSGGTEEHLWSSHYDGSLEDIFAVQSEIAEKVAGELRVHLLDSEKQTIEEKDTENSEAYTLFLRGRELLREGSEPEIRRALGLLEKAVGMDPAFAKALTGIARCYQLLGNNGYEPYWESIAKAKVPLRRALELDPGLAEAHASLSLMLLNEDDFTGAEAEAKQAIQLNPSLPEGYDALSNIAWIKEDLAEGTRLVEAYYRLDPLRPTYVGDRGTLLFYLGREREALEHWQKTLDLSPAATYRLMTEYYVLKGDLEKARELHAKVEKLQPTHPWVDWMKGFIAAKTGDEKGALEVAHQIESKRGNSGINEIGFVRYALGDLDSYFECLNRALDMHNFNFVYPMYCPLFAEGRKDPRYRGLVLRQMSLFGPLTGSHR